MSSDICGDLTIVVNSTHSVRWSELPNPYPKFPGTSPAYIRPDGEALLPWIITLVVILFHLPVVVLRVVKWEIVQTWSFVFTGLTIAIYIQAYVSTRLQPGDILVWTPVLLIIDAGSMSQIFFLLNKDIYLTPWAKRTYNDISERVTRKQMTRPSEQIPLRSSSHTESDLENQEAATQTQLETQTQSGRDTQPGTQIQPRQETAGETPRNLLTQCSSILAVAFFILIILLQILGLIYAIRASHNPEPPLVRWCSPLFQPFGIAVRDGNCNIHPVDQSFNKGIGCIVLPGVQQAGWITGTIWATSISLILELSDVVIQSFTNNKTRFQEIKMRRPWCTIIMGLVVLAVMLIFGILYSKGLPEGITSRIWVVVQAGGRLVVYEGELVGAGMRGECIGWIDALFKSWGRTYFGNTVS